MEQVIEGIRGQSSPHELAIHFLLRHAERRMALTSEIDDSPRLAAVLQRVDPENKLHNATLGSRLADAVAAHSAAVAETAPEDSYAARFSRAYAAARHIPATGRNRAQAQLMSGGSSRLVM
jgi:hypothetical protein